MKVAVFTDRFPALSETFVLNQITGLIDRGHEVDIFPRRPGEDARLHPDVMGYALLDRVCPPPPPIGARLLRGFGQALRLGRRDPRLASLALNPLASGREAASLRLLYWSDLLAERAPHDVILCHAGNNARTPLRLRSLGVLRGRLAIVFHGWDLSGYAQARGHRLYEELFASGDLFLPVSERWKQRLLELGCPQDRTIVHRMGIDPETFSFTPRTLSTDEPIRLLSVGRLVEKKGIEYGIRAVVRLLARGTRDIRYTIIGDGPLRMELATLIREHGATDAIEMTGAMTQVEVRARMQSAHLMLTPSVTAADGDQEGIPVVLMEAMASGLPVVSTRHSGIPELVENGVAGYLVPERDVDSLADALAALIADFRSWCRFGCAGRDRVLADYNVHTLNDRLVRLLERLGGGGR